MHVLVFRRQHAGARVATRYLRHSFLYGTLGQDAAPGAGARRFPGALPRPAHTLVALVQHAQAVLGFHILSLHHLELSDGRGQELHLLRAGKKGQRGSRGSRARAGGGTWAGGLPATGSLLGREGAGRAGEVRGLRLTWSSWFLSISSCGRFSSVMLIDCAMLGRRAAGEEAGRVTDALASLRGSSVVPRGLRSAPAVSMTPRPDRAWGRQGSS